MRRAVFVVVRALFLSFGLILMALALNHGFGVEAPWYWWFVLCFGTAWTINAWSTNAKDVL